VQDDSDQLIVSLGLTLALILGVFMLFMTRYQRNGAIEQASHLMLTVGQAIVRSMERSMRQGDMASIQETLESMTGGDIASLRIIDWNRAVTQSDRPAEIGSSGSDALVEEAFRTGCRRARTWCWASARFCARSSPCATPRSAPGATARSVPGPSSGLSTCS
jgi:hypothetical protein